MSLKNKLRLIFSIARLNIISCNFSRGGTDKNSDIDILVEIEDSKQIGLEFIQMQPAFQDLLYNTSFETALKKIRNIGKKKEITNKCTVRDNLKKYL